MIKVVGERKKLRFPRHSIAAFSQLQHKHDQYASAVANRTHESRFTGAFPYLCRPALAMISFKSGLVQNCYFYQLIKNKCFIAFK